MVRRRPHIYEPHMSGLVDIVNDKDRIRHLLIDRDEPIHPINHRPISSNDDGGTMIDDSSLINP